MKLKKILQPGCDQLHDKLYLFAIGEEWLDYKIEAIDRNILQNSFAIVKSHYQLAYYHTLYHLLTCAFCLDRAYDILEKRSHLELWRLGEQHPGDFIDIVRQLKHQDCPKSRYFILLYTKLVVPHKTGVLFRWGQTSSLQQISTRRAAGIAGNLPPDMAIPNNFIQGANMSLHFQWDTITGELNMGLIGGSAKLRLDIKLQVFYLSGEKEEFFGEDIAIGGMWGIAAEKAKNICRVDFIYQKDKL